MRQANQGPTTINKQGSRNCIRGLPSTCSDGQGNEQNIKVSATDHAHRQKGLVSGSIGATKMISTALKSSQREEFKSTPSPNIFLVTFARSCTYVVCG